MSDQAKGRGLLVPDSRVVSIDEAKKEAETARRGVGKRSDLLTRGDAEDMMKEFAACMAVNMAERIHADLVQQTQGFLDEMEQGLHAHVENEIRRRSLYGRFRALLIRLGAKPKEKPALVPTPKPEDEWPLAQAMIAEADGDGD